MNAALRFALYRNRPPVRHRHEIVPMTAPERAERVKAGLPVLYEYCEICGCVPAKFFGETPKLLESVK